MQRNHSGIHGIVRLSKADRSTPRRMNQKTGIRVSRRNGFTLIELLVVISIIATLMSLILPAIQNAREAGRRTQCMNRIRNISIALQGFATAHNGQFPDAGTWLVDSNQWGNWPTYKEGYSWVVDLLPYLDYQSVSDRWDKGQEWNHVANDNLQKMSIAVLTCPDDQSAELQEGGLSYVVNSGYNSRTNASNNFRAAGLDWDRDGTVNDLTTPNVDQEDVDVAREMGLMWNRFVRDLRISGPDHSTAPSDSLRIRSIYDGSSNTIALTENLNAGPWARPGTMTRFMWTVDPADPDLQSVPRHPDADKDPRINAHKAGPEGSRPYPSSGHPGGVTTAFCDGAARFVSEDIDDRVWAYLISPAGSRLRAGMTVQEPLSGTGF